MNTNSYNILYVDDEKENLTSFKLLFRKDFNVIIANSAQEGLSVLKEEDITRNPSSTPRGSTRWPGGFPIPTPLNGYASTLSRPAWRPTRQRR